MAKPLTEKTDRLLTAKEAAARIKKVRSRISQLISEGQIEAERFGRGKKKKVRIRESEIDRYLQSLEIPETLPATEDAQAA